MYNNDVTYNKKWDTVENLTARKKIVKKFFDRSVCCPDCPTSWAVEVLELLETIDRELGIVRNTQTMNGFNIRNPFDNWIIAPFMASWRELAHTFFTAHDPEKYTSQYLHKISFLKKLKRPVNAFTGNVLYTFRAFKVQYINEFLNKILKPKVHLSQIKEKYGELTVYFSTSDVYEEYIERLIKQTEIKLAIKGAYTPIETFWNSTVRYSVGTDYHPDTVKIKQEGDGAIYIEKTTYRDLMKEMGLDLKEIELKYHEYKKKIDEMDETP
jgi:hypothetical protein